MRTWQNEIDQLERAGYLPELRNLVRSHTCPVWWYDDRKADGHSILHSGTLALVNTGLKVLAISANHVFEQYLKDKETDPNLKCQLGNVTVEPEKYVIDSDKTLDLVTFDLPVILATATGVTIHNSPSWPPPELHAPELVIFGGYPGNRRAEKSRTLNSDFVSFISRIGQSSEDHVSVHLNMSDSHWPQGERMTNSPDLGGMSGGPVFRLRTGLLETLEFAGVVYESSRTYELVFSRHASFIQADGSIQS